LAEQGPWSFGRGVVEVTEDTLCREEENLIEFDELLVEEVSIDGMCGVY
jgi:mycofactocin precursor